MKVSIGHLVPGKVADQARHVLINGARSSNTPSGSQPWKTDTQRVVVGRFVDVNSSRVGPVTIFLVGSAQG